MVIYYPKHLCDPSFRWHIFPLLKKLNDNISPAAQICSVSKTIDEADLVIIPMSWNYYYNKKKIGQVLEFLKKHKNLEKEIISFITGDTGSKVPSYFNGRVLRASGNKAKLPVSHRGLPIFVEDPIKKFYQDDSVEHRKYYDKPVVGFCGQANHFKYAVINEYVKVFVKNIMSKLGFININPQKLMSTSYFRYKILKRLQEAKAIQSNFIIRDQYRAGIRTNKDAHKTTLEFYDNIMNSDYVVCMRGAGNFSNRFYETLAMGRIPVFINTDCLLPLDEIIDWKKHVVWIEYKDRHKIAEKIIEFHNQLDEVRLNALFESNRQLWQNKLTLLQYFEIVLFELKKNRTSKNAPLPKTISSS